MRGIFAQGTTYYNDSNFVDVVLYNNNYYKANQTLEKTCGELDVPFLRPGSLMVSYGPKGDESLKKKYEQEVDFYYNKWHKILEDTGTIFENLIIY